MSQYFKSNDNRVAIFQDWNILAPKLKLPKNDIQEKSKPEQIRRAEELINDAQLLKMNISMFFASKKELEGKIQDHKEISKKLLDEIHQLNSNQSQDLRQEDSLLLRMKEILQGLFRQMRTGRMLEQMVANYFQNANLANYNPQVHQLKYAKSNQQTQLFLKAKLEEIENCSRSLFRSIHFMDKLPAVFAKEESFDYCYSALLQLISHDSLVRIHANMICQLQSMEKTKLALIAINRSIEAEYLKYELIDDCLQLMRLQTNEIEDEKQQLEENFNRSSLYVYIANDSYPSKSRLIGEENQLKENMNIGKQKMKIIEGHLKVYRTNLQNFTRVSAQTSLYCYAYRRSQFAETLNNFEHFFAVWKNKNSALNYLYDQRSILQSIKEQQGIRQSFSEAERQRLTASYQETRNKKLPEDDRLEAYRKSLLTDFEKELQRHRIGFSQRSLKKQDVKFVLSRQNEFFQKLKTVGDRKKVAYLRNNKEIIDKLIFQLEQLEMHSNQREPEHLEVFLYMSALSFARVIATGNLPDIQLQQFQALVNQGKKYQQLPHGMTEVVLSYTYDLKIITKSQPEVNYFGGSHREQFLKAIQSEISTNKMKIDDAVQKHIYMLEDYWLSLHMKFYRFLTPIGEQLMLDELREICMRLGRDIHNAVHQKNVIPELKEVKSTIFDQNRFYQYPVLLSLVQMAFDESKAQTIQKFKIANLDSVLDSVFFYFDRTFVGLSVKAKSTDLIKLSLLESLFLRTNKDTDYFKLFQTLRLQVYLQFISEVIVDNAENQKIRQNWLQPLSQIHFRMNTVPNSLSELKNRQLSHKGSSLLESIRNYPLTILSKRNSSELSVSLSIKQLIQNLRQILSQGNFSITEAGEALVALRAINEARKWTSSPFENYQNVVLRKNTKISYLLEQVKKKIEKDLSEIGEEESLKRHFQDSRSSFTLQQGISRLLQRRP